MGIIHSVSPPAIISPSNTRQLDTEGNKPSKAHVGGAQGRWRETSCLPPQPSFYLVEVSTQRTGGGITPGHFGGAGVGDSINVAVQRGKQYVIPNYEQKSEAATEEQMQSPVPLENVTGFQPKEVPATTNYRLRRTIRQTRVTSSRNKQVASQTSLIAQPNEGSPRAGQRNYRLHSQIVASLSNAVIRPRRIKSLSKEFLDSRVDEEVSRYLIPPDHPTQDDRSHTPSGYSVLGVYKRGSLRIMNGAASPVSSMRDRWAAGQNNTPVLSSAGLPAVMPEDETSMPKGANMEAGVDGTYSTEGYYKSVAQGSSEKDEEREEPEEDGGQVFMRSIAEHYRVEGPSGATLVLEMATQPNTANSIPNPSRNSNTEHNNLRQEDGYVVKDNAQYPLLYGMAYDPNLEPPIDPYFISQPSSFSPFSSGSPRPRIGQHLWQGYRGTGVHKRDNLNQHLPERYNSHNSHNSHSSTSGVSSIDSGYFSPCPSTSRRGSRTDTHSSHTSTNPSRKCSNKSITTPSSAQAQAKPQPLRVIDRYRLSATEGIDITDANEDILYTTCPPQRLRKLSLSITRLGRCKSLRERIGIGIRDVVSNGELRSMPTERDEDSYGRTSGSLNPPPSSFSFYPETTSQRSTLHTALYAEHHSEPHAKRTQQNLPERSPHEVPHAFRSPSTSRSTGPHSRSRDQQVPQTRASEATLRTTYSPTRHLCHSQSLGAMGPPPRGSFADIYGPSAAEYHDRMALRRRKTFNEIRR